LDFARDPGLAGFRVRTLDNGHADLHPHGAQTHDLWQYDLWQWGRCAIAV